MDYDQIYEFCFLSTRRSGHHAIMNWIAHLVGKQVLFINNIHEYKNPFDEPLKTLRKSFDRYCQQEEIQGLYIDYDTYSNRLSATKRKCLIYNYENCQLQNIKDHMYIYSNKKGTGTSKEYKKIIILRDFLNTIASIIKQHSNRLKEAMKNKERPGLATLIKRKRKQWVQSALSSWEELSSEIIGKTSYLNKDFEFISFNKWVQSKHYRKKIALSLGLEYKNIAYRKVPNFGGGSSFSKNNNISKKNLNSRWKVMTNDKHFKMALKRKDLIERSKEIFGDIYSS